MKHVSKVVGVSALVVMLAIAVSGCSSDDSTSSTTTTTQAGSGGSGGKLVGLFKITPAECASGPATAGSYFRMVAAGGTAAAGPYVANQDSTCGDKNYSALEPGTDGGLETGQYQTQPTPPFDATKNGLADRITAPTKFFAVGFAVSTNKTDPQTSAGVPAPTITSDASGALTGNVSAVTVAWNGQQFNQGAPKPDGSKPGGTADVSGTYDSKTGAYTLEWASAIVGGPFNGFTGVWHLAGTFEKS